MKLLMLNMFCHRHIVVMVKVRVGREFMMVKMGVVHHVEVMIPNCGQEVLLINNRPQTIMMMLCKFELSQVGSRSKRPRYSLIMMMDALFVLLMKVM